ncbi:hypothetical protein [Paraburkholderia bannensis]|uniref:hypothetical protein n=1 Tax=Paraburkholderia bannensis TaxID=765414 RepID=UPI002ABD47D8|nr:hypothetical protein [Paraburkholderia bannensis]
MNENAQPSAEEQKKIDRLKTPEECEQFLKNIELTHPHLIHAVRRHAVSLRATAHNASSPVLRDIWEAVYAYEEVLYLRHKRRLRAGHTRRSIALRGAVEAIEEITRRKELTEGFHRMREAGLFDKTFEAVVMRHPTAFSMQAVAAAKEKLERAANPPSQIEESV